MFSFIQKTQHPPQNLPLMVWDGNCGFCEYWVTFWQTRTDERVIYRTYQEVHEYFKDIPTREFKKASRFIEIDGSVYSGPDSAYKCMGYFRSPVTFLHRWYHKSSMFFFISNHVYNFIAKHRPLMMRLTTLCFGKDPMRLRHFWLLYLIFLVLIAFLPLFL